MSKNNSFIIHVNKKQIDLSNQPIRQKRYEHVMHIFSNSSLNSS